MNTKKVVDWFIRLCVAQSAVTSHLFMRRLDFAYKKRTKNSVQNIKNSNLTRTGIFGNFRINLDLTDWFASVLPSERGQLSVTFCNLWINLGLTDLFASVLPSQHCQLSGKFSNKLGLTDQIKSVGPKWLCSFCFWPCFASTGCIRARIKTIFVSKSIDSTRRTTSEKKTIRPPDC